MLKFTTPPTIYQNPNPIVPLAAIIEFEANRPVETTFSLNDGRDSWTLQYGADQSTTAGLPVTGMRPGTTLKISVSIKAEGETVTYSEKLIFQAPLLPSDPAEFPTLRIDKADRARMEPGLTLVFARRRPAGEPTELTPEQRRFMTSFGLIIALNSAGEVVWYFVAHARIADMTQLRNGNFLYITTEFDVTEVDVLGNVVQQWYAADRPHGPHPTAIPVPAETIHHCIYELSNGNFMAFTANKRIVEDFYTSEFDPNAPRKTQPVMGDTIIEFTREGEIVWRWNCFD
ncbi:MAG: aryl-sulfate sulfotransferase, partial [Pseudomonadota bacterium]